MCECGYYGNPWYAMYCRRCGRVFKTEPPDPHGVKAKADEKARRRQAKKGGKKQ